METSNIAKMELLTDHSTNVSFCTAIFDFNSDFDKNMNNIIQIAEDIGLNYEIIVSCRKPMEHKNKKIKFIQANFNSYGHGKQIASSMSSGKYIIIFNPNIEYNIEIADIIYKFIKENEKKCLVASFTIINRDLLTQSNGWRNLKEYEDIDLFARIAKINGFIVYPSEFYDILNYREYGTKNNFGQFLENIRGKRDTIISCNFKLKDALRLIRGSYLAILLAGFLARFSMNKPYKYSKNNYIIIIESIIESLILEDYKFYNDNKIVPKFMLSRKEIEYLTEKSELWNKVNHSLKEIINIKDD